MTVLAVGFVVQLRPKEVCECCMPRTEAGMCNRGEPMKMQNVWLLQAGLIQALAKVLKQGRMGSQVQEGVSEALKQLSASSQKNRDTLVASQALPIIIAHLPTGHPQPFAVSSLHPCSALLVIDAQQQAAALRFVPLIARLLRAESVHSCVQVTHVAGNFLVLSSGSVLFCGN